MNCHTHRVRWAHFEVDCWPWPLLRLTDIWSYSDNCLFHMLHSELLWLTHPMLFPKTKEENCLGCYHIRRFQLHSKPITCQWRRATSKVLQTTKKRETRSHCQSVFLEFRLFFYLTRQNKDTFLQGEDSSCRYTKQRLVEMLLLTRNVEIDTAKGNLWPSISDARLARVTPVSLL